MPALSTSFAPNAASKERADEVFREHQQEIYRGTDALLDQRILVKLRASKQRCR